MSYKSILFFIVLFGFLIFGYFCYDKFLKIFPINIYINFFVVIIGVGAFLFPDIISKLKAGDDWTDIKKHVIEKYRKR